MHRKIRVLKNQTDLTASVTDFNTAAAVIDLSASDTLHIGTFVPINTIFLEMSPANAVPSTLTVEVWDGRQWVLVVDLIDLTKGMTATGIISWEVDRDNGWSVAGKSSDVAGLSATKIYDCYWLRIKTSANQTPGTAINYVGQKFCTEADLTGIYSDLGNTNLKNQLGKNGSWDRKIIAASELIVADLISKRIVWSSGQLLDWSLLKYPCIHKTAEIIYSGGMGEAFVPDRDHARKCYGEAISLGKFSIDLNNDGVLSPVERRNDVMFLSR